jgi:branched-chain amino acid transport system substrate-binding protein
VNIARQWFDGGVDAILDVNNSAIAMAINGLAREKNKVHLNSAAASADLTGHACSPNMVHWTTDTWAVAQSTAGALARAGAKRWFFITADYAFGHAVRRGWWRRPAGRWSAAWPTLSRRPPTSRLSWSAPRRRGRTWWASATPARTRSTASSRRRSSAWRGGASPPAAMIGFISEIHTLGLPAAQGLVLTESFYWDLNDRTRALNSRLRGKMLNNHVPNSVQAQGYGAAFHYMRAVAEIGAARAKASGLEAVQAMKRLPADDDAHGTGSVRADGRKLHPTHLFQVKAPDESRGPWDYFKPVATTPAEQAFRPLAEGNCPLVKA